MSTLHNLAPVVRAHLLREVLKLRKKSGSLRLNVLLVLLQLDGCPSI